MLGKELNMKKKVFFGILSVVLFLFLYECFSYIQHQKPGNANDTTIPRIHQMLGSWNVVDDCGKVIEERKGGLQKIGEVNKRDGSRWIVMDFKATLTRLFLGLIAGIAISFVLGIAMGCFPVIDAFLIPPISLFSRIPATATMAVFFVLVGTDTEMYISIIAFGIVPALAQILSTAVKDIPSELIYKAKTLGASKFEIISLVIVPYTKPKFLEGVRMMTAQAVVFLVAAEMLVGSVGLGYRVRMQQKLLAMEVVYLYILLFGFLGLCLDLSLRYLQQVWCRWYIGERSR